MILNREAREGHIRGQLKEDLKEEKEQAVVNEE